MTSGPPISRISREDLVEQSVNDYVKTAIFDRLGYPPDQVEMLPSFPYHLEDLPASQFSKNYIAAGVHFDDGGRQAELGSSFKRRYYTVEYYVIGQTLSWARNLANQVKAALERDQLVPLKDYAQPGFPVIDQMYVDDEPGPSATRQYVPDPEAWQRFIYMAHCRVIDEYYAAVV